MSNNDLGQKNIYPNKNAKEPLSFGSAITDIVHEIESINFTLDNSIVESYEGYRSRRNNFDTYIENNAEKVEKIEGEIRYTLRPVNVHVLQENIEKLSISAVGPKILANAMFASLIFRWDAYFAKILRLIFLSKAEVIDSSQRSISFSELTKFPSIDDARNYIMEAEIEDVMRESHTKQFETLNRYLGKKDGDVTITSVDEWSKFIEITERRNLIVHTDSVVSKQYLEVCKKNKSSVGNLKIGDNVSINKEYMDEACSVLTKMAFITGHYVWQKFRPGDVEARESHFLRTTYAFIRDERYSIAERLIEDFLADKRNHQREYTRKACHINLAQAYKWSGQDSKCLGTLKREDWSYSRDNFVIASLVLKEEFDGAAALMRKMGKNEDITRSDYDEWPLFKKFRESEAFKSAYTDIYGEETTVKKIEAPVIEPSNDEKREDLESDGKLLH